ncbi:MAG: hypothetical protein JNM27_17985 [Leptospirales bacterium]|nr:hypothetical protein [Leptospirales bacterium]
MDYESLLDSALARRVNPEKTRRFDPARFETGLRSLEQHRVLQSRNNPLVDISVVGTNGKGSTSFLLAQLFEASGPVGLYTSPHLHNVRERLRIGLSEVDAITAWDAYQTVAGDSRESGDQTTGSSHEELTYFELLTLMAGTIFSQKNLPVRIYEAGLGGRLDATRVFKARAVVLTSIALDHTELLGDTPLLILREKLGIISERTEMLLCMPQPHLTNEEIEREARNLNANLQIEFFPSRLQAEESYLEYNKRFAEFCARKIYESCQKGTPLKPPAYPATLRIPGRLAQFQIAGRSFIFDPAHNPDALRVALLSVSSLPGFPGKDKAFVVFGILPDRNLDDCLASIRSSGFENVCQVIGGPFRAEKAGLKSISFDALSEIVPSFAVWNVFLGSHKLYDSFLDLLRGIENLETNASVR